MTALILGSAPEDAGVIVGRIVDTTSGEAVAEAQIVVPAQGVGTVSDDEGYFVRRAVQRGAGEAAGATVAEAGNLLAALPGRHTADILQLLADVGPGMEAVDRNYASEAVRPPESLGVGGRPTAERATL